MKIGIIGGGQLGKLFADNLKRGVEVCFYSPYKPLSKEGEWFRGDLLDADGLLKWVEEMRPDVVTIEIENVSIDGLRKIQESGHGISVYPDPDLIEMIQNKLTQKRRLEELGYPVAELLFSYENIEFGSDQMEMTMRKLDSEKSVVNKLKIGGYDGQGVRIINVANWMDGYCKMFEEGAFVEKKIEIAKELSVIVGRNSQGNVCDFPLSEMVFDDRNMLDYLVCPAQVEDRVALECSQLARKLAEDLELVGILAVEFFLDIDGKVWINELAPRLHNSGHHTVIGCLLSQHELLYRCLIGLALPESVASCGNSVAIMMNIVGKSDIKECEMCTDLLDKDKNIEIEWYGKRNSRVGRKMGHITFLVENGLEGNGVIKEWIKSEVDRLRKRISIECRGCAEVGVIMGSSSDLGVVQPAVKLLRKFGVVVDVKVVSAHRTPEGMLEYAKSAGDRGIKVILAAAGGAAHLPGMVASATILPVIGIPVKSANSIDGWDSLLSIAQMPSGIPVATMALNGAVNGALMAVRILALNNQRLAGKLEVYCRGLKEKVEKQNRELDC